MLSSLSEKNKVSACKWRALSDEEREAFNEQANSEQAKSSSSTKKEMRKALSSLTNIVSKLKFTRNSSVVITMFVVELLFIDLHR